MGYFRGIVDESLSRVVEAFFALPIVIIALLALTALGPSNWTVVVVIGLVFTPLIARTVRSAVLSERELEYVSAARLRGERAPYIMFVEILPNILPPIVVEFTVRLGYAIFTVATLSFLGFGIQPPAPDWGLQIAQSLRPPGGLLVAIAFPSARDRYPRRRGEPDRGWHPGRVRAMTARVASAADRCRPAGPASDRWPQDAALERHGCARMSCRARRPFGALAGCTPAQHGTVE